MTRIKKLHNSALLTILAENDGTDRTVRLLNTPDRPFPSKIMTEEDVLNAGLNTYQENLKYTMCFAKPEAHCQVRIDFKIKGL